MAGGTGRGDGDGDDDGDDDVIKGVEQVRRQIDETSSVLLGKYSLQLKPLRSLHLHMRSLRIIIFEGLMC
jgi:hypothetical protein